MKLDLYDFDGTIYDGDSGVDLILFSIKKKPSLIFYYIGSLWVVIKFMLKLIKKEEMNGARSFCVSNNGGRVRVLRGLKAVKD
jgi:hypothetical protein